MFQIVFSDVDGTLLNDQHKITPLTLQAIKNIQNQGISFVIVSARSPSGIYPILQYNYLQCPIIAYSGALIMDKRKNILYEKGMNTDNAIHILKYIEQMKFDISWCVYSFDQWIVKDRKDSRIQREERIVKTISQEGTLQTISTLPTVHKILCICHPDQILYIERSLKEMFSQLTIVKSSSILIEVMEQNISKASAIEKFCKIEKIDKDCAIAFGDQYNDLEMLKTVGYGYAMGNAPSEIKKEIEKITLDNNHDGIFEALKCLNLLK